MAEREDELSRDHDRGMGRHEDGEESDALAPALHTFSSAALVVANLSSLACPRQNGAS